MYLYDVFFNEIQSSVLAYTSQPYAESMAVWPAISYILYSASSGGKTVDVIMFAQFDEGNILSETRNDTEIGDESDDDSTLPSLIIE